MSSSARDREIYNSHNTRKYVPLVERGPIKADRERMLASIPDDTRTLTGRIMGDPLPGRSALDMRRA